MRTPSQSIDIHVLEPRRLLAASIMGVVFDDANGNGVRETGESAFVRGRTVFIDADNDAVLDAGERSVTTVVDGYGFDNVAPGKHTVRVVVPPGLRATTPTGGAYVADVGSTGYYGQDFGLAPVPTPADVAPTDDAYVRGGPTAREGPSAGLNFGADAQLVVRNPGYTEDSREYRWAYLKFDVSNLTPFTSAKLRLYGALATPATGAVNFGVSGATDVAWSESLITWKTKPVPGTLLANAELRGTRPRWYEWEVGDYLRQRKAAGAKAVTLVVQSPFNSGAVFHSAESADPALRPRLALDAGPLVQDVMVSSSKWSYSFRTHLRNIGLTVLDLNGGFALPMGDGPAPPPLPWDNVDIVKLRFAQGAIVGRDDLHVTGPDGAAHGVRNFSYDRTRSLAQWTLDRPAGPGTLSLELSPSVTDAAGNPMTGGPFRYEINVLPGDADRDGRVTAADAWAVRSRLSRTYARPGPAARAYGVFHDLNGDGRITALDVASARAGTHRPASSEPPTSA